MFLRNGVSELEKWRKKARRKPLVLRGARQVGKTTLVQQFAEQFSQYIYLNLELPGDREPFQSFTDINTLVQALFFLKNQNLSQKSDTLIFIDEIQEVPEALTILRYFYEQEPSIPVIAAGSMLETLFDKDISFPVGRVEYKIVRPVSFPEFLGALGETAALQQLTHIPLAPFAHSKLLDLFHIYALIGGMPEIVNHYARHRDLTALGPLYDSLITSYLDDVEKYASGSSQVQIIRHTIRSAFAEAGKRITFHGFGNSAYGSREIGEALRTLEKALLLHLVYPTTGATLPILPEKRKSPRLQILDTGMLNYFAGIQKNILGTKDLNSVYQGTIIEHLAGQELLASQYDALNSLNFWVREKNTSSAEVDFLYKYEGKLVPIEIKSGKEGKLKSLHQFMDMAPHSIALRYYAGELYTSEVVTPGGKKFTLLNLPYFLVSQTGKYLDWIEKEKPQ